MDLSQRIKNIIAEQLKIKPDLIRNNSSRSDLSMDSLDFLDLAVLLEDEFNVLITDEELAAIKTIGELSSVIEIKIEQLAGEAETEDEESLPEDSLLE